MDRDIENFEREVAAFIERYAPRSSYGRDFEHELRGLLIMAFQEAQKPFAYELKAHRDSALNFAMASTYPPPPKA